MTSKTVASAALLLASMLAASTTLAAPVTVGNHSFETTGGSPPPGTYTDWRMLPAGGDWLDGNATNDFEILRLNIDPTHFPSYNTAPDGLNVLNLPATSPMSQDLSPTTVNAGDVITLDFFVGDSAVQTPGNVNATFTLDGSPVNTQTVINNASSGDFAHKSVQYIATSAGNLGIEFSGGSGAWIDDVGVDVSTAPTLRGDVNVTNWDSVYFTDLAFSYAPTASGFGGVENSLPQDDDNSYSGGSSGSQTYGGSVSWADGEAASDVGTPLNVGFGYIYPNVEASASLDLDLTGAPLGTSAEGLTTGEIGGTTFDASDTGGQDGSFAFEVDFTIDALAAGSDVNGSFGIQVDIFQWGVGDLGWGAGGFQPYVTGTGITGAVLMTEETRTDELGDARTFALTAADIAAAGGSVDGTYTAHFDFDQDALGYGFAGNPSAYVTISAFARGEAELVPEPSTFALAFLALVSLLACGRRTRR